MPFTGEFEACEQFQAVFVSSLAVTPTIDCRNAVIFVFGRSFTHFPPFYRDVIYKLPDFLHMIPVYSKLNRQFDANYRRYVLLNRRLRLGECSRQLGIFSSRSDDQLPASQRSLCDSIGRGIERCIASSPQSISPNSESRKVEHTSSADFE